MSNTKTTRIPKTVWERANDLQDERDFATIGEAIRHMCRQGNYDV